MFFLPLFLVNLFGASVFSAPVANLNNGQLPSPKVLDFMKQYGYVEEDDGNSEALYTESGIAEIIKTIQRYGAIEETGKIDNATLKLMSSRRCGVQDIIRHKRRRRYTFGSAGWGHRNISYFISNWSPHLGEYKVVENIQRALDTWGGYGRLNFRRSATQDADIIVYFASGDHYDGYPFDGPGAVLGHAFFPQKDSQIGGDIHFDADEYWTDRRENNSEEGTDFYSVALHELGHSLGLAHSPVPNSVMFPYYKDFDPNSPIQLDYDDILGMYNLYITKEFKEENHTPPDNGYEPEPTSSTTSTTRSTHVTDDWFTTERTVTYRPSTVTTTTGVYNTEKVTPPMTPRTDSYITYEGDDETVDDHMKHDGKHTVPQPNSPSLPNICDGYMDAIATLRNQLFVFKDQYVWRYKERGQLENGYPITIYEMFSELPKSIKKIDAAYERPDGYIVLFTGKMFWVYNGQQFIENSPKSITHYGLPDYLDKIDAVQTWGRNRKTYFYRNERFWRYNEALAAMDPGYPLHMERWRGVPENLNAATTWKDGATYFFKGEYFWKFDNNFVIVTEQSPLPTAQVWFGCAEEEQKMIRLFP